MSLLIPLSLFIMNLKVGCDLTMSEEKVQAIRQDYINGLSYKAISIKYQIDARTAKRYVQQNLPLSELEQRPFSSVLDPYKPKIDAWLSQNKVYSTTIYDWLLSTGCRCGYTIVNNYVQKKIRENEDKGIYSIYEKKVRHIPENKSITNKSKEEKNHVNSLKKQQ